MAGHRGQATRRLLLVVAVVGIVLSGCTQQADRRDRSQGDDASPPPPAPPPAPSPPAAGPPAPPPAAVGTVPHGKLSRSVVADNITRHFVVHVPSQVDGSARVPAVIMLHGTSGTGDEFYNRSGWVEEADAEGLVAVFPTALRHCLGEDDDPKDGNITGSEYRITTKWASGKLGGPDMPLCPDEVVARLGARAAAIESRTLKDDVAFFDALASWLTAELPVDPKRIYATGFSNGASMAARLLLERSATFAAFAMVAGGPNIPGTSARAAPVWFSVGSLDDGFTQATGVAELPLDETFLALPAFRGMADTFAASARVNATQYTFETRDVNGKALATFRFDRALDGGRNVFLLAVEEDATHQYPNGRNHPMVMADLLWVFFRPHALP